MKSKFFGFRRKKTARPSRSYFPRVELLEDRLQMAIFMVSNTNDAGPGSLRAAIIQANTTNGDDVIQFDSSFNTQRVITLTSGQLNLENATGITGSISIQGPGANLLTISGNNSHRVMRVAGLQAELSGLTITGGRPSDDAAVGGGIYNAASLTMTNCVVSGNHAGYGGGGIVNYSLLTMNNCTVSGNSTDTTSNVRGYGGGILNWVQTFLNNSTLANNQAYYAGGIYNGSSYSAITLSLMNTTISGNSGNFGSGLINAYSGPSSATNTIIAGNNGAANVFELNDSPLTGSNNILSGDARLASLGYYGGTTPTMPLLPGSPAINAGTTGFNVPATDQRGLGRFGAVDIGAVESQGFNLSLAGGNSQTTLTGQAFASPLSVGVTANNSVEPVNGGIITFSPPGSGASANLSTTQATISGGIASVTATANGNRGSYNVTATTNNANSPAFTLTNQLQPSFFSITSNTITYGQSTLTLNGGLTAGGTPATGSVLVTISGNGITPLTTSAMLGINGAFSAAFATSALPAFPGSPYTVTYSYSAQDFFRSATNSATTLTVQQAALSVTANSRSKFFGQTLTSADYTGTLIGVVAGDNITASYDSPTGNPANASVAGSPYAILATLNDPNGRLANYTVSNTSGQLTVVATTATVSAPTSTNITSNAATLGGNVTTDGGAAITERGILVSITSVNNNPQMNGNGVTKIVALGTTGVFTVDALGLDPGVGYSYVAFATNSVGTTYTTVDSFTTPATLATLTTPEIGSLTATSVRINGILPTTGGSIVTEFGYVYAKTADDATPQVGEANVSKVNVFSDPINGNAAFNANLLGLQPGTQYSLSTYAINSVGTSYSTTITFTTLATAPTVNTPTQTNVTSNSATLGGDVTTDNGAAITERGILLAKTSVNNNPLLGGNGVTKITATGTTGVFTVDALGLDYTTGYSYVAFATNSVGTTYTTVETFTTLATTPTVILPTATNVTSSSATLGGDVTVDGGAAITERGILLAKTSVNNNPQLNGNGVTKLIDTGTTGVFTVAALGLDPGIPYSFVAFATNSAGTTYTTVEMFTTLATLAVHGTPSAMNITAATASIGGSIPSTGGSPVTSFGYVYAKTSDDATPQLGELNVTQAAVITSTFFFNASFSGQLLAGLQPGTQYSLATYATNSVGTSYSTTITFTTQAVAPSITAPTAINVSATSATLGGNVTTDNGAAITERGVLYAKTSDNGTPQLNGPGVMKLVATGTTGVFTVDALGLDPATGYSYVAFATNSVGTTYTTVESFTTVGLPPTVTAPTAANITLTGATLGGNVTSDGQVAISERGIVYSITSLNNNPQIGGASVTQVTTAGTTGVFTIDVTALPPGTQISYAAYATNSVGTTYTTVGTFTTQPTIGQFPGITVQILGGHMIVTGTEQDDTIKVASDGMGGYIVTANKNINGLPSPQSFSGATSFVANTLGGHDDLWLAAPLTLDDVTVDLGNGNDRLVLGADPNNAINNNVLDPQFGTLGYLTVNGPVSVIGSEGNDRVIERSTNINGVKTINLGEGNNEYNVYWGFSNETIFSSGAGTDNVYIGYLSLREASQFDTGAGNDLISYYASRFYKTAYLNSGAGADTVALDVNIYDEATTVDTGSEADYLLFSRSVAYKSVVLTTAAGADTVLIGKYISGLGSNGSPIYSNGGSNIDDLTLNTGVEADTVQVAANVMRLFFANLGDAYDDAEVEFNLFTDGFLDGGGQDMRLRLRGNAGLRTRNPG